MELTHRDHPAWAMVPLSQATLPFLTLLPLTAPCSQLTIKSCCILQRITPTSCDVAFTIDITWLPSFKIT